MVETRRRKQGRAPAAEAEEPAAKRQRGDGGEERARPVASGTEKREFKQAKSNGGTLSDATRAAWDAFFREQFFFRPPSEFYALYELAHTLDPESALNAFVAPAGIRLCGPFELLSTADAGKKEVATQKPLFLHGRFSNDPPEVLTALVDVSSGAGQHWGYFRDAPDQDPRYVVCSHDSSKVAFEVAGSSLLHVLAASMQRDAKCAPQTLRSQIAALIADQCGDRTVTVSQLKKQREREITAPSLHGLGVVVPVNAKTETGFRELPITGSQLASLLENVREDPGDTRSRAKVNELITRATIASDECDFGTGLLLGLDLLTAGSCLQKEATRLLRVAYSLLKRSAFFKIVKGQWGPGSAVTQQLKALCTDPKEGEAPKTVPLPRVDRAQD